MSADNQQRRLNKLSWLGGIIDGEGMITVIMRTHGCSCYPRISIVNCDKNIIEEVTQILNELNLKHYIQTKVYVVGEEQHIKYEVLVNGIKRCIPMLHEIIPYLVAKKERAQKLLVWCNRRLLRPMMKYTQEDLEILSIRQRV